MCAFACVLFTNFVTIKNLNRFCISKRLKVKIEILLESKLFLNEFLTKFLLTAQEIIFFSFKSYFEAILNCTRT